jgi:hypothetical protein
MRVSKKKILFKFIKWFCWLFLIPFLISFGMFIYRDSRSWLKIREFINKRDIAFKYKLIFYILVSIFIFPLFILIGYFIAYKLDKSDFKMYLKKIVHRGISY